MHTVERFLTQPPDPRVQERCTRGDVADGLVAALTWRKVRLGHLVPERRAAVEAHVRAAVAAGEPVRLVDSVGGFKGHRAATAPGVGWAEVFHLAFMRRWLLPLAERYEPGVALEYAGQGEVATWVDNIPAADVATYTREFGELLGVFRRHAPGNLDVRARPLAEDYDLARLRERFDAWEREEIPADRAAALDARLDRAANNYRFDGERDDTGSEGAAREELLRRSVWKLTRFYEHDAEARRGLFNAGILMSHGIGFAGAYGVRAVEGSDKTFWMAEGAVVGGAETDGARAEGDEPADLLSWRPVLVMPDDPVLADARWETVPDPGGPPGLARVAHLAENASP